MIQPYQCTKLNNYMAYKKNQKSKKIKIQLESKEFLGFETKGNHSLMDILNSKQERYYLFFFISHSSIEANSIDLDKRLKQIKKRYFKSIPNNTYLDEEEYKFLNEYVALLNSYGRVAQVVLKSELI